MKNKDLIKTWERAYNVTQPSVSAKKRRLRELQSWDKPLCNKQDDTSGKWAEWACKIIALENLL